MLIAGVSGGKSLIRSAKIQQGIKELNNLKTAINIFYERYDRLPGDINNDGTVSFHYSPNVFYPTGDTAPKGHFAGTEYADTIVMTGPLFWVELYLKKLWNFHILPANANSWNKAGINTPLFPYVRLKKNVTYDGVPISTAFYEEFNWYRPTNHNYIVFQGAFNGSDMRSEDLETFDKKMDDGNAYTGFFRAYNGDKNRNDFPYKTTTNYMIFYYRVF